jgi:hypothetical protein
MFNIEMYSGDSSPTTRAWFSKSCASSWSLAASCWALERTTIEREVVAVASVVKVVGAVVVVVVVFMVSVDASVESLAVSFLELRLSLAVDVEGAAEVVDESPSLGLCPAAGIQPKWKSNLHKLWGSHLVGNHDHRHLISTETLLE